MMIKEVQELTGLGRKAIEYYQQKGLIDPAVLENGYRDYSREEADTLRHIALLRALDVPLEEIRALLSGTAGPGALLRERQTDMDLRQRKTQLMEEYAKTGPTDDLKSKLDALGREESLAKRFFRLLPGYFGQMLLYNFAPFLEEPAASEEQERAFEEAVSFLDSLPPLRLPLDLAEAAQSAAEELPLDVMRQIHNDKRAALRDPEGWFKEHEEFIKAYGQMKQTEEYRSAPVVRAGALLKAYFEETGYYERFIPLMRRLSPAYDEYYREILRANTILMGENAKL